MPRRPREHQLEDESRVAFDVALGRRFLFRREEPDYGIDGMVEEFDGSGRATGLRYLVQLKATDQTDLSRALKVSVKLGIAEYYRSLSLPVLMVRYVAPTATLFARWFHQFDPYYGRVSATSVTFRWDIGDRVDDERPARLAADARAFLTLRSARLPKPLEVYLESAPQGAFGLPPSTLLFALRNAAAQRPDVFAVKRGAAPGGAIRVIARDDLLSVNLANVGAATAHLAEYEPGAIGEQFAIDAMVVAALAFEHVGHSDLASRLATGFLAESSLVGAPEIAWGLSSALTRSRGVHDSLRLADALDSSPEADRRAGSNWFVIPAMWHRNSLEPDELDRLEDVTTKRITRRLQRGENAEAGRNAYNLANVLRSVGQPEKAITYFELALEHDPTYANRPYFHKEMAGVLFCAHRYDASATAYKEANRLHPEPETVALGADALMFAGHYAEARDIFADHNDAPREDRAEWRLKELFLDILVDDHKTLVQHRDTAEAARLLNEIDYQAASSQELQERLEAVLHADALAANAWFNLGRAHLDLGQRDAARIAYLAAALCNEGDAEAWLNVIILSIDSPETAPLAEGALQCARRFAGEEFRRQLVCWTQAQPADFPTEKFLDGIDEHLQDTAVQPRHGLVYRTLSADGGFEEMILGGEEPA